MEESIVRLVGVTKTFGSVIAVNNVSLEVKGGEFFSVLGPSGCGKTTLLRLIAGLETVQSGEIYLKGKPITYAPPYKRDVNMVFQNYALFPHMNVYENVSFSLKLKGLKKSEIHDRVMNALDIVNLRGLEFRKIKQLSGGQQQRVALARALVNEPSVLLLDEPLGALDLKLRKQMQIELKNLQKRLGITFIYVTHDQEEALTMSDRITVMNFGILEQTGTPLEIYEKPKTQFVANFIGVSNFFHGDIIGEEDQPTLLMETYDGFRIKILKNGVKYPKKAIAMIRPEKIQITLEKPVGENINYLRGKIEDIVYLGTVIQFIMDLNGRKLIALDKNHEKALRFSINQDVFAYWDVASTVIMAQ